MEKEKVFLGTLEKVASFVSAAERSPAKLYLKSDDKTVNAKSLIGIASMDLGKVMTLEMIGDEDSLKQTKETLGRFLL